MKISDALRKVAEHEEPGVFWDWKIGLCTNIYCAFGHGAEQQAKHWMRAHPDYSGSLQYPIPACPDYLHGQLGERIDVHYHAYQAHDEPDMYSGTYGRTRREWAMYLAILFAAQGQ